MLREITPLHYFGRLGYHYYRGSVHVDSINQSVNQSTNLFIMLATHNESLFPGGA